MKEPAATIDHPPPVGLRRFVTRAFWIRLWKTKRRIIIQGAVLGILFHILLLIGKPTRISRWIEDASVDWMINLTGMGEKEQPKIPGLAFTFIDIDDKTLEAWPAVPYTPRDKLLELIRFTVKSQAAVVIVDVNLTHPINPKGKGKTLSDEDRALAAFLKDWSAPQPSAGEQACRRPAIILTQDFRRTGEPNVCRDLLPSFLDPYINPSTGAVLRASVEFEQDMDKMIRYWRLWERGCEYPYPHFPAVQWLAAELVKEQGEHAKGCTPRSPETMNADRRRTIAERIAYSTGWDAKLGQPLPGPVPVTKISGAEITDAGDRPISGQLIKDRVVVIGGSAEALRDIHLTPIGDMPGALILINSIYALVQHGELHTVPHELELLVAAVMILLASVFFALFSHFWAYLVAGLLTALAMLPLSFVGFRHGYWLDFAAPLIAVQLHHMWAQFEEAIEHRKKHSVEGAEPR